MKAVVRYLGSLLLDGFLLLLPLLLSYLMVGVLFDFVVALAQPIQDVLPESAFSDMWELRLCGLGILIVICLLVGLAARSELAARFGDWIERRVLSRFAPYAILRSLSGQLSGRNAPDKLKPVLLKTAPDTRVIAFIVEELQEGELTIFVPFAATPGVGQVQIVSESKVERLQASMMDALGCLFNWGDGAGALLKQQRKSEAARAVE